MKATIVGLGLLAAAVMTACGGGSSSAPSGAPAASTAASPSSSATQAASGDTSAAPSSTAAAASGASGTCKYLSDADAATLLPNAGQARVTTADAPAGTVTSCHWGTGTLATNTDVIVLIADELKIDAALAAAKESIDANVNEKIDGLGDSGGFSEKGSDSITVEFIKGKVTVQLTIATPGVNADAAAALAKKIAAKL